MKYSSVFLLVMLSSYNFYAPVCGNVVDCCEMNLFDGSGMIKEGALFSFHNESQFVDENHDCYKALKAGDVLMFFYVLIFVVYMARQIPRWIVR